MYDVILGWDFGHGENCVEMFRYGSGNDSTTLRLDSGKRQEIPTVIAYRNQEVLIGYEAAPCFHAIPYFKSRPDLWDAKIAGLTKKDMIYDFFKETMNSIRKYNQIFDTDRILLMVGCPSGKDWTNEENIEKYQALIQEATKVEKVIVMPESRAALLSVFTRNTDIVVDTYQGAGVFDFGSSTADFTYMKFGEHMLEYSRNLGGVAVERNMLKKILADNGLTMGDVWEREIGIILLTLRFQKERFYAYGEEKTHIFEPIEIDDEGEPISTGRKKKDGSPIYRLRSFRYRIDEEFMDAVTTSMAFTIEGNHDNYDSKSWDGHCRDFIISMKNTLSANNLPIKNIILTGGASRMDFVQNHCKAIFGKDCNIFIEKNPSHSVSTGLCNAGITDLRLEEIMPGVKERICSRIDADITDLISEISHLITDEIYTGVVQSLKFLCDQNEDFTIGSMRAKIEQNIEQKITESRLESIINPCTLKWIDKSKQIIVSEANNAVKSLYPDAISNQYIRITKESNLLKSIKFQFVNTSIIKDIDFVSTIEKVIKNIIVWIVATIGYMVFNIFFVVAHIAIELLADYLLSNENRVIKAAQCEKIYKKFSNNPKKNSDEIYEKVLEQIKKAANEKLDGQFGGRYAAFNEPIESAMNVIALREFNNIYHY